MASYWYNFDSNDWSAVYKHTYGKDYKFKAGYDSAVRLGWASIRVSSGIYLFWYFYKNCHYLSLYFSLVYHQMIVLTLNLETTEDRNCY